MTTNVPGTRPSSRPSDPVVVDAIPTPVVTPAAAGGVAVFDRDVDAPSSSLHPSASMVDERVPAAAGSTGSMLTWIISAVVLIVLVYILLNYVF